MALTIGDNFSYMGAKPLDARLKYDTIAAMKAMADSTLYEGCLAYCTATGKTYQWKSTNTVDADLGKWREFTSGSGATDLADLGDVNLTNLQDGQILKYNGTTEKFENAEDAGGQTIQFDTLPTADADHVGQIVQYVGETTASLTNGFFYECVSDGETPPTYSWNVKNVQDGGSAGHTIESEDGTDMTARENLQFVNMDVTDDQTNNRTVVTGEKIQYDVLPTASADYVGKTVQYIGADTGTLTHNYFYECVEDASVSPSTYAWVESGVQSSGTVAVMRGATNYDDGESGLVPKPYTTDVGKALFGDGHYHTIYSSAAGSTVMAITTESSLIGRDCTLSDGRTTLTEQFDSNGEAIFTDVQMYGNCTLQASDGEGNTAKSSVNISYFGTYATNITMNFATIRFTSTDMDLIGKQVNIYHNNVKVAETTLRLQTPMVSTLVAEVYVEELGEYTAKIAPSEKGLGRAVINVVALRQTYVQELLLYHIYTWQIDENDSNPATCVTPYDSEYGCENLNFTPAHMDFANDVFNYGSWTGDEFFFPKPCLLAFDGTVTTYLNPDNLEQDLEGNTVDITSASVNGNVMVEFPTIYFKRWRAGNKSYCLISNKQIDSDFHAYAHHDINGAVLPYIYIAAFDGSFDGTRLRSLAGKPTSNSSASGAVNGKIMSKTTRQEEVNYAKANYTSATGEGWNTWHKADRDMVNDLLILMGMSTETQDTFGCGRDTGWSSETSTGMVTTGSMKTKGAFWGENQGAAGVKVFHIENWWGNIWKAYAGHVNANGTQKVKMTYGKEDGSNVNGFNFDGANYVSVGSATPAGTSGGYVNKWKYGATGMATYQASGSQTTYLADGLWFNNSQNNYALGGGDSSIGRLDGAFSVYLSAASSRRGEAFGAALSYKSLV